MTTDPHLRDRTRPAEILGFATVVAVFVAAVVLLSSRDLMLAVIALGVTFILSLVIVATLALTVNASADERIDLDEQDRSQGH